jgi:hypothetical protein
MMGQPQALCEEDEIINRLRESRSDGEMFFDVEFGGVATALYENESEVPEYGRRRHDVRHALGGDARKEGVWCCCLPRLWRRGVSSSSG